MALPRVMRTRLDNLVFYVECAMFSLPELDTSRQDFIIHWDLEQDLRFVFIPEIKKVYIVFDCL